MIVQQDIGEGARTGVTVLSAIEVVASTVRSAGGPDMGALGTTELLIVAVIGLVSLVVLGLVVWAVVDMAGHSEAEFAAIGSNRTAWLVSTIALTFVCGIGWVAAVVYLLAVRPKLRGR